MSKSKAFTLAEVLITLVIIGVIAAMTIPTLMGSTNRQELKTAYKKAVSAVRQSIALDYALYGTSSVCGQIDDNKQAEVLKNHMSVIEDCIGGDCLKFKTADGMIYDVRCGWVGVDVNGDKGNSQEGEDIFTMGINHDGTVYPHQTDFME